MVVDHIGIVVRSIEKGLNTWTKVFKYEQMTEIIVNTKQKVKVVFLKKNNSIDIKLIEPTDNTSPIYALAQKGGGLHHLCFKCDDLDMELKNLNEQGLRIITKPEPGEAFQNEKIAFVYGGQGLNIEVIDTEKRAGLIKT